MLLILTFGVLFGVILQYAGLNQHNVITGLTTRRNYAVAKAVLFAVGLGAILLAVEINLGLASYHVKPFLLGGIVLGGLVFGSGMALLGYCPGTLPISLGTGSIDALIGIVGGLVSGWVFTLAKPSMHTVLGPNLGKLSVHGAVHAPIAFYAVVIVAGASFMGLAFWVHKRFHETGYKWLYAGVALAVLNPIVFLSSMSGRPIGASTTYPYAADVLMGATTNGYFTKIHKPGSWELVFLAGAALAGLVYSLARKEFKLTLVHDHWREFHGPPPIKRGVWAFPQRRGTGS